MRLMIFYDLRNFEASVQKCGGRFLDVGRVHYFLVKKINSLLHWKLENKDIIRAYAYTGAYTESFIKKIKWVIEHEKDPKVKELRIQYLQYAEKQRKIKESFIEKTWEYNFFELKSLPLRYSFKQIDGVQKGVDVELAVDLVSYAYKNAFDVAVVCSGDSDLQRSMEMVKALGKRVILMSHPKSMSKELRKSADYFIDISKLSPAELDEISHEFVTYQNVSTTLPVTQ